MTEQHIKTKVDFIEGKGIVVSLADTEDKKVQLTSKRCRKPLIELQSLPKDTKTISVTIRRGKVFGKTSITNT